MALDAIEVPACDQITITRSAGPGTRHDPRNRFHLIRHLVERIVFSHCAEMLGRLLSTAASSFNPAVHGAHTSARPTNSLESVQEDIHTRHLLFPDASLLHQPHGHLYPLSGGASSPTVASASGFDCYGDLDLESPRDTRVLIAQDATGSQGKAVLYDSNPPQPTSPKLHNAFAAPEHPQPLSSAGIASAGFLRARRRGTLPTSNPADIYQGQHNSFIKPEDEIKVLTDCMFGAAPLSYKGSSTKVHIIPTVGKSQSKSANTSPTVGDGQGSFGRAEGRRRSHLAQSYTPSNPPPGTKVANVPNTSVKANERKTVLITRLFSIAVQPTPTLDILTPGNSVGSTHSFPFPRMTGAAAPAPSKLSKAPRTAMYAIGLILQLPSPAQSTSGITSRSGHRHHNRRMSNSSNGHEIFSSSFESDNRIGYMFSDPSFGFEAFLPISGDGDDRMEIIAQHWDVITRALSALQSITQEQIVESLRQAELAAPAYTSNVSRTRRSLELWPNALIDDEIIKRAIEVARLRVVRGLRIPRVVTGQGRWGIWREEARWVGRWAGGKEQNFFFFNLLTAFLGNHTQWLDALGPPWYRRRHQLQQRACSNEDLAIPSRTVIVASDKMAARRLIFLLSAFLPAMSSSGDNLSPYRPVTSSSRGYSQSPPMPSFMRKESLRRTINKRVNVSRSNTYAEGQMKFSTSLHGSPPEDSATVVNNGPHSRRPSDTSSIRSKNLPILNNAAATSATTTTTVTPATTVPHFSTHQTDPFASGTAAEPRPGSSGSLASLNLMHTLKRNNSTNYSGHSTDSGTGSLWGSLISGFWSNRRYSSTEASVITGTEEGLGISGVHRSKFSSPAVSSSNKLEEMVAESHGSEGRELHGGLDEETPNRTRVPSLDQNTDSGQIVGTPPSQAIPAPGRTLESPLKLSVDENDGVIDVDIQLPGFLNASLGSPMSSPSTAGFMSLASLEGGASSICQTSACPFSSLEQESPVNVAGWLKKYHADFALQAVCPHVGLEEDIKLSMKAEPTPSLTTLTPSVEGGPIDKWVDVSTVLIADTRNFSITRLRLKRRVKLAAARPSSTSPPANESGLPARSQYGNPYSQSQLNAGVEILDGHLEGKLVEESIMDLDGTLVDAVEKIIAQSHYGTGRQQPQHSSAALGSAPDSNTSSRSSSRRRGRRITRADSGTADPSMPTLEIPRGECKNMVLGALEQVVLSVASDAGAGRDEQQQQEQAMRGSFGNIFRKKVEVESTLREGVRKWLRDVEEAP